ncbi:hypothetical protein DB345_04535 [Spartobacteria bacterium LR76]|nr:hypothetical protein DB345_04535 [Spartobacteria bacterium LR76]
MGCFSVPSYRDTPGLQKFPPEKQHLIYRTQHRKLLDGDPAYHRACLRYSMLVVGLCLLAVVLQVLQIFNIIGSLLTTLACILFMIVVIVAAFRAQRYRNFRIGWELQKQEASKV